MESKTKERRKNATSEGATIVPLDVKRIIILGVVVFLAVTGSLMLYRATEPQTAQAKGYEIADSKPLVPATVWLFAEGYTGEGFEEWILLFNPPNYLGGTGEALTADVNFFNNEGFIGNNSYHIEPGQRVSINVNQELLTRSQGYSGDVSVVVKGGDALNTMKPLIAERAIYFNYNGVWTGGSQTMGYPVNYVSGP